MCFNFKNKNWGKRILKIVFWMDCIIFIIKLIGMYVYLGYFIFVVWEKYVI